MVHDEEYRKLVDRARQPGFKVVQLPTPAKPRHDRQTFPLASKIAEHAGDAYPYSVPDGGCQERPDILALAADRPAFVTGHLAYLGRTIVGLRMSQASKGKLVLVLDDGTRLVAEPEPDTAERPSPRDQCECGVFRGHMTPVGLRCLDCGGFE